MPGHWPMITPPEETIALLAEIASAARARRSERLTAQI
jgi:hypothetical protein